jgi:hypothetical protein
MRILDINIGSNREKALSPEGQAEQARVDILNASVGAVTVALADPVVIHQKDIAPLVGATVTDIHASREAQRTGVPLTSVVENPTIAPDAVSEAGRSVVMGSFVEADNMSKAA